MVLLVPMQHTIEELEELARKCRIEIVKMVYRAQAGHPGGSLSEIDLLAGLYGTTMRVRPDDPDWEDRDRFILSKGCLLYTSPSPRDRSLARMPSSA